MCQTVSKKKKKIELTGAYSCSAPQTKDTAKQKKKKNIVMSTISSTVRPQTLGGLHIAHRSRQERRTNAKKSGQPVNGTLCSPCSSIQSTKTKSLHIQRALEHIYTPRVTGRVTASRSERAKLCQCYRRLERNNGETRQLNSPTAAAQKCALSVGPLLPPCIIFFFFFSSRPGARSEDVVAARVRRQERGKKRGPQQSRVGCLLHEREESSRFLSVLTLH